MSVSNTVGAVHIVSFSVCLSVSVSGFCFLLSMRRINVCITSHCCLWSRLSALHTVWCHRASVDHVQNWRSAVSVSTSRSNWPINLQRCPGLWPHGRWRHFRHSSCRFCRLSLCARPAYTPRCCCCCWASPLSNKKTPDVWWLAWLTRPLYDFLTTADCYVRKLNVYFLWMITSHLMLDTLPASARRELSCSLQSVSCGLKA